MASIIQLQAQPGKTGVTIDIYPEDNESALITGLAVTETSLGSGYYEGTYSATDTGIHRIYVKQGLRTLANWYVYLSNNGKIDKCGDISADLAQLTFKSDIISVANGEIVGPLTNTTGDFNDTIQKGDANEVVVTSSGVLTYDLLTTIPKGQFPKSIDLTLSTGTAISIGAFNFTTSSVDVLGSFQNAVLTDVNFELTKDHFNPINLQVRVGVSRGTGESITIDFAGFNNVGMVEQLTEDLTLHDESLTEAKGVGFVGSDSLRTISSNLLFSIDHMRAMVMQARLQIETVTNQTEFIHTIIVPAETDTIIGSHIALYKGDDINEINIRRITNYDGGGTYTIDSAPSFILTTNDTFTIILNKEETPQTVDLNPDQSSVTIGTVNNVTNPVDIDMGQALPGVPLNLTTGGALALADTLSFKGGTGEVNASVQDFEDTEWKRVNEEITLAENYAAVGSVGTISQILNLVLAILQNPQYINFEFRARRLDGSTEAAAFQMDSSTDPTQHNRIR